MRIASTRVSLLLLASLASWRFIPATAAAAERDRHGDPLPSGAIARLGTLRFRGVCGHLTFSPDGKRLATAAGENGNQAVVWDVATGREVWRLAARGTTLRLAFSPDGGRLAVSDLLGCRVVDAATGKKLMELEGTYGTFAADGKTIVTCLARASSLVRSWDTRSGKVLREKEFAVHVREFAVAADGRTAVVTGQEMGMGKDARTGSTVAQVLDLVTGKEIRSFPLAWSGFPRLRLSADGKTLSSADFDGVRLWNVADGKRIGTWNYPGLSGAAVFSPDGKRLAWTGRDEGNVGDLRLWVVDIPGGKPRPVGPAVHYGETPCFSPDGKRLAVLTGGGALSLRDVESGDEVLALDAHRGPVVDLAFGPDGRHVVSRSGDDVLAWEAFTGKLLRRTAFVPPHHEYLVPLLPGGLVLTGERTNNPLNGRFWLREALSDEEPMRFDGRPDVGPPAAVVAPGGRYFGIRGRDGAMGVYDTRQRRRLYRRECGFGVRLSADGNVLFWYDRPLINVNGKVVRKDLELHVHRQAENRQAESKFLILDNPPRDEPSERLLRDYSCMSPDGRWLVLPGGGDKLRRWDLTTGREAAPLTEALPLTWGVAWSPDGRFVAVRGASAEGNARGRGVLRELRVWDVRTGARLRHLTVPHGDANNVLFSADGRLMLRTELLGRIRLIETASGQDRLCLDGHLRHDIGALALRDDGRVLVSGGYDTQVLVWDVTGHMPGGKWHPVRNTAEQARAAWEALASSDGQAAHDAIWRLAADAEGSVALIRRRLPPVPRLEKAQVAKWIAALDSAEFAERERAARALEEVGESAADELRQALKDRPSLEVRRRVEAILGQLDGLPRGRQLQALRAVEVLEHVGTPEAKEVLRGLAGGAPAARLTEEARRALDRMERP